MVYIEIVYEINFERGYVYDFINVCSDIDFNFYVCVHIQFNFCRDISVDLYLKSSLL